jgi:phosphoglycolate phosphatase-like HAD superfamily hydrolase
MSDKFVLFDFDGVIADSYAVSHEIARRFCTRLDESTHKRSFENNIFDSYEALKQEDHGPECEHGLDWFGAFAPRFKESVRPFPDILPQVAQLADEYSLAIISSSPGDLIRYFLDAHGAARYFIDVLGNDAHKSKVEKMSMVFQRHGASSERSVFVTDTLGDMREAKAHEVGAIGVAWGFHDRATLERGFPFRIVDSPQELPDAVEDYFAHIYARA